MFKNLLEHEDFYFYKGCLTVFLWGKPMILMNINILWDDPILDRLGKNASRDEKLKGITVLLRGHLLTSLKMEVVNKPGWFYNVRPSVSSTHSVSETYLVSLLHIGPGVNKDWHFRTYTS